MGSDLPRILSPEELDEVDQEEWDEFVETFMEGPQDVHCASFWADCEVVLGPDVDVPTCKEIGDYHGYIGRRARQDDVDIHCEWVRLRHDPDAEAALAYRVWNTSFKDDDYILIGLDEVPAFAAHVREFNRSWRRTSKGGIRARRRQLPALGQLTVTVAWTKSLRRA